MNFKVKSSSPDGMTVELETFLTSYNDLKAFIDWLALLESGKYKEILNRQPIKE